MLSKKVYMRSRTKNTVIEIENASISDVIITLTKIYLEDYNLESAFNINCGLCPEFAEDVIATFGGALETTYTLCSDELMVGEDGKEDKNEVWDFDLLAEHWGAIPPKDTSREEMNAIGIGYHVWVFHEDKHYDSECPNGVTNIFDLPFFRRWIDKYKSGEWKYIASNT